MAALLLVAARGGRLSAGCTMVVLMAASGAAMAAPPIGAAGSVPATALPVVGAPARDQGLSFKPDAGVVFRSGDFSVTTWGFAERLIDSDGSDSWRRVRQGAEVDLPRFRSNQSSTV